MTKSTFHPTSDFNDEIEAVTDLILDLPNRCPFAALSARRDWIRNELKIIAGVYGNRWPGEIYGACMIAGLEDREKYDAVAPV